jgi:hypothetical protein
MTIKPGYIRVSEILGQWDRFGSINPDVLKRKAQIGTNVHSAINAADSGVFMPLEEGMGYFESWELWISTTKAQIVHSELRLYDDGLKITGCVDALIKMPFNEELILVDYKTSVSESPKIWPLQAIFYYLLAKKNGYEPADRFLFIRLDKTGKLPKIHEYKYSSYLHTICMAALACYKYINED